jgi:hypothetical protein
MCALLQLVLPIGFCKTRMPIGFKRESETLLWNHQSVHHTLEKLPRNLDFGRRNLKIVAAAFFLGGICKRKLEQLW